MKVIVLASLILLLSVSAWGQEISDDDADYIVKVISKLDKYVTWPEDVSYEGGNRLLVLTVVGNSPINAKLKKLRGQKTPGGKKIKVRVVERNEMPANSHVLVVSGSNEADVQKAIELLGTKGTLIIGMNEGFGEMGCMLNFTHSASIDKSKMGFEINRASLKEAQFQVNPSFHKLAKVLN